MLKISFRFVRRIWAFGPALPVAFCCLMNAAQAADAIDITIDFAKILPLNGEAATIIVGNPGIADVALEDEDTLVLTGRAAGTTNLIVMDREGKEIANELLRVSTSYSDVTTVFYGSQRQSFSCTPTCEQVISVGDNLDTFDRAIAQIAGRNKFSLGARANAR